MLFNIHGHRCVLLNTLPATTQGKGVAGGGRRGGGGWGVTGPRAWGRRGEQKGWEGREEQCWPLVKCLVFHKQAAFSYTPPETPSPRRGFKEKHVHLPSSGAPSSANGDFALRKHILISPLSEKPSQDTLLFFPESIHEFTVRQLQKR